MKKLLGFLLLFSTLAQAAYLPQTQIIDQAGHTANVTVGHALLTDGSATTQPVSIAGPVAVTGTFFQATQPVSAATWPLPLGASTSALQSAMITALGSPFQAGGSIANTAFGISGTLPNFASVPTFNIGTTGGIALDSTVSTLSGKFGSLGQKTMVGSAPVVIASDQSAIPVTGTLAVTQSTSPWVTSDLGDGSVSGGAAGTKSLLSGGIFNTVAPTLTNGQQASLQFDVNGNLKTTPAGGTTSVTQGTTPWVVGQSSGANLHANIDNFPATQAVTQSTSPWVVSGTVTANAGTNLNTSALALESGGHLASIDTKLTSPLTTNATLQAGSALVGKVGIDQTTPGTTNGVVVNSGSITANAGTNLNTSALALSANQTNGTQKTQVVDGSGNVQGPQQTISGTNYAPVVLAASATAGAAVVARSIQIAGSDGTNAQTLSVDTTGKVNVNNISGTVSLPTGSATSANQTSQITQETTTATNTTSILANQTNGTQKTQVTSGPADVTPATQNITTQDVATTTTAQANGQNAMTGTPTAGSAASFAVSSIETIGIQVTGAWTGTLVTEISRDGGTTWFTRGIKQSSLSYLASTFTQNFEGGMNGGGVTNVRVRSTAALPGTATVRIITSVNPESVIVSNPQLLRDTTTQSITNTIKAASTAAIATDTALVVAQSPNSPLPAGTNLLGSVNQNTLYQGSGSGSIVANGGTVIATTNGATSVSFSVTGTYSGAVVGQGSTDASTYLGTPLGVNLGTGAIASTLVSVAGTLCFNTAGLKSIQLIGVFFVSGTANIAWTASNSACVMPVANVVSTPLYVSPTDGAKTTYSASATVVPAAAATDVCTLAGSSTKTIRVLLVRVSGTATVAVSSSVALAKRSTADTAGTSSAMTNVRHDSGSAAATAAGLSYTANPTLGTLVGNVRVDKTEFATSGAAGGSVIAWDFGDRPSQAIVLRGTAEQLAVNLTGTSVTGGSINCTFEWSEE